MIRGITAEMALLLCCATACTSAAIEDRGVPPVPAPSITEKSPADNVVLGHGRDRTASTTAEDWATYADHVVVVTVAAEAKGSRGEWEQKYGEGMVGRSVTLRVDKVIWSAPDASQPVPAVMEEPAHGWVLRKGRESRFVLEGTSRLERGHRYIVAWEWLDDPCSADSRIGLWAGLGSGGVIPFDTDVLGVGEYEGGIVALQEARTALSGSGIRGQVVGKAPAALTDALNEATPRQRTSRKTLSPECDDHERISGHAYQIK